MQADTLNRLRGGTALLPTDFQRVLLAAQNPQNLARMVGDSQGHVEVVAQDRQSSVTKQEAAGQRLIELQANPASSRQQQTLIRVHTVSHGESGYKRAKRKDLEVGSDDTYLKSVTFGGRANFLPADRPVIFKRSLNMPRLQRIPAALPEEIAKFRVEEVKLVVKNPSAKKKILVTAVECQYFRKGPSAKPTLVFTAEKRHGLRPGSSCVTMPVGGGESFTAPVDTVTAAENCRFTVKGYLDSLDSERVADYLTKAAEKYRFVTEEHHVQNDQPYLYCVTILEGSALHPLASEAAMPAQPLDEGPQPQRTPLGGIRDDTHMLLDTVAGSSGAGSSRGGDPPHGRFASLTVGSAPVPTSFLQFPSMQVEGDASFKKDVNVDGDLVVKNFDSESATIRDLTVTGEIKQRSDARGKQNIARLHDNALELVSKLKVYSYSLRSDPSNSAQIGFLAQQVKQWIPTAVVEEGGRLHIKPTNIMAILTQALQEMQVKGERQWAITRACMLALDSKLNVSQMSGSPQGQLSAAGAESAAALMHSDVSMDELIDVEGPWELVDPEDQRPMGAACAARDSQSASSNPLTGRSVSEAAKYLMAALGETNAGVSKLYKKLFDQLDQDEVYGAMQQALETTGLTANGERNRSAGGEFIRLCKQRTAAMKTQSAALTGEAPQQLRLYQERVLGRLAAGENIVLVLPTGGGKTEVALQHTLALLRADPGAKTVFVVPNVALAFQQAGYFERKKFYQTDRGGRPLRVGCYHSDNPLAPRDWTSALGRHNVVVATAQMLLNALNAGTDRLTDLRFLVFDEVHHAKDAHPYNAILQFYRQLLEDGKAAPQILGMTATPGAHTSESMTEHIWAALASRINGSYAIVDHEDSEVLEHVPRAEQQPSIFVQPRPEDLHFSSQICAVMLKTLDDIQLLYPDMQLPPSIRGEVSKGAFSPALHSWASAYLMPSTPSPIGLPAYVPSGIEEDGACCLRLVSGCNVALMLREEAGHEAGNHHIVGTFAYITEHSTMATEAALTQRWKLWKKLMERLHDPCGAQLQEGNVDEYACMSGFPKFRALADYLETCCVEQPEFHGMVFVRTRLGLHLVARALARSSALASISFMQLIGKGSSGSSVAVGPTAGMSGKEQAHVLDAFRKRGGRKVLVATAAGLEGLDVADCNFCVRYNASQTAIERVQSRGRTRKANAKFIEIFESGSQDGYFQLKSNREEHNMAQASTKFKMRMT